MQGRTWDLVGTRVSLREIDEVSMVVGGHQGGSGDGGEAQEEGAGWKGLHQGAVPVGGVG